MIPKRVELENFLSFGTPATDIRFDDDEPLWVLGGPNGVGKSAVFDAITYCLFGEHRGGASDHASLIRHGANAFRAVFEFEFAGTDYRITRTRPLTGRPTQRVERRANGTWVAADLPPATGRQDPVRLWSEQLLGLGYDAFQASVLLRQGEADKILTAGPTERGAILRKIIGADRYKALGDRVHEAAKGCRAKLKGCKERLDGLSDVSADAVAEAAARLEQTEADRMGANQAAADADRWVTEAKQWATLTSKVGAVEKNIADADERAQHAECIRADKARLDDLSAAVPVVRQLVTLRTGLEAAHRVLDDRQAEADRVAAAIKAHDLRQEMAGADEFLKAVEAAAAFPADLADRLVDAQTAANMCAAVWAAAGKEKAAAGALLKQAKGRQKEFAEVGVGVKCSRCGQEVTEKHAQLEREGIDREVGELETRCADADAAEQSADAAKQEADLHLNTTTTKWDRRTKAIEGLTALTRARAECALATDADELHRNLPDRREAVKQAEADAGDQAGVDHRTLLKRQSQVTGKLGEARTTLATDQAKTDMLTGQLTPEWRSRLDGLDADAVHAFEDERQGFVTARVADRFQQLELDAAQRSVWVKQRDELARETAAVPEAARVPVPRAEADSQAAREAAVLAEGKRDAARTEAERLTRQRADRQEVADLVAKAERQAWLHQTLDELLGKGGLQRELVRSAEREIVRLTDDTVRHLSDGDLTVELDADPDGDDAAFALRIRRADDPCPIGVAYLSGSQRFRVAVAVALAIGRYAAGQARPLESVIIDEGFGSLDRDGLTAMADELNRLKRYLRRIVLVSHQEEFADRFPVVIRLSRGDAGTVAKADRR